MPLSEDWLKPASSPSGTRRTQKTHPMQGNKLQSRFGRFYGIEINACSILTTLGDHNAIGRVKLFND